jgi:hypothetical protein
MLQKGGNRAKERTRIPAGRANIQRKGMQGNIKGVITLNTRSASCPQPAAVVSMEKPLSLSVSSVSEVGTETGQYEVVEKGCVGA